ncbi:hypothetical protein [Aliikangiella sp. G2MR2-5]|uniref:hypothetical protein n=1 Tax=Aliikangiella sp. G2MR2-5 TaxID=2788943 RepID=UPI0018AAD2F6|nr:hypothetical protein [Aliikangiella sp. G2MR2-5]
MLNSQLNSQGYVPFHPTLNGAGYQLYTKPEVLDFLNNSIQDDYTSLSFFKKLLSLRSNPRNLDAGRHKSNPHQYRMHAIDGILVDYKIESGCVCIDKIQYNPDANKKHELPGLHLVKKNKVGTWEIKKRYVTRVQTPHMAVNGQSNDRKNAQGLMATHLQDAYSEEINEFTLFHNPTVNVLGDTFESLRDKIGGKLTNSMTKRFAKVLDDCQSRRKPVKTVAHSQGAIIYSEGVNYHNKTKGTPLDHHTVFFQAPGANMAVTKNILNKAGVKLHKEGVKANPFDAVPQVIGMNAITDMKQFNFKNLARLAVMPLAIVPGLIPLSFSSPELSPHTRPYPGLKNYGKQVGGALKDGALKMLKRVV